MSFSQLSRRLILRWLLAGVLVGGTPMLAMGAEAALSGAALPEASVSKGASPSSARAEAAVPDVALPTATLPEVTVWRSPSCGCCGDWIAHMRAAGFSVRDVVQPAMHQVKTRLGVPARYASCHTATVGQYLLEGHVPASDVKRLLAEAPEGRGLLVPGMPIGSPGMEVPGRANDAYDVLLLDDTGGVSVFASH